MIVIAEVAVKLLIRVVLALIIVGAAVLLVKDVFPETGDRSVLKNERQGEIIRPKTV